MNTKMFKAILDGRKTVIRRVVKNSKVIPNKITAVEKLVLIDKVSKYQIGETIFVKEKFQLGENEKQEMARIFLKITDVRVERLQKINRLDVIGDIFNIIDELDGSFRKTTNDDYAKQWNKTAPKGDKWEDNPYVFVYEFERVEK